MLWGMITKSEVWGENIIYIIFHIFYQHNSMDHIIVFFWKRFYHNCCKRFWLLFIIKCGFSIMVCQHILKWLPEITWMPILWGNELDKVDQSDGYPDWKIYQASITSYESLWSPFTRLQLTQFSTSFLNYILWLQVVKKCLRSFELFINHSFITTKHIILVVAILSI